MCFSVPKCLSLVTVVGGVMLFVFAQKFRHDSRKEGYSKVIKALLCHYLRRLYGSNGGNPAHFVSQRSHGNLGKVGPHRHSRRRPIGIYDATRQSANTVEGIGPCRVGQTPERIAGISTTIITLFATTPTSCQR
jgi:hypothetical protein